MIYEDKSLSDFSGRELLKAAFRKFTRRIFHPVSSSQPSPHSRWPGTRITLVDVGASGGAHERWKDFDVQYVLVEPDHRADGISEGETARSTVVVDSALSDANQEIEFHLCQKQTTSSVYSPNAAFIGLFPDAARFTVVDRARLKARRLDGVLKEKGLQQVDFIKLDAQGHELPILRGVGDFINNVIGLEIEVEFAPMYANQPLFPEVNRFALEHGFTLYDLRRHFWQRETGRPTTPTRGQLVFGDALYFREPEQIVKIASSEGDVLKACLIYMAYGYADLALVLVDRALEARLVEPSTHASLVGRIQSSIGRTKFSEGPWHSDEDLGNC